MVRHQYQYKIGMILVLVGFCCMIPTCSQAREPAEEAPAPGTVRQSGIEVEVYNLFVDPASQQPVVTLVDHEKKKAFPIWIGLSEAQAIQSELEGTEHFRPLTHDLLADILIKTNVEIHRVLITHTKDNVFYATLIIENNGRLIEIDARPSDSIVLALKFKAPIYIDRSLFEKMALSLQGPLETEEEYGIVLQELTDEMAQYLSLGSHRGVMIAGISKGSRAARDGLETGDVIVELGGQRIDNLKSMQDALAESRTSVKAKIYRNRKFMTLTLHLRQ